jgi:hypothetical protein
MSFCPNNQTARNWLIGASASTANYDFFFTFSASTGNIRAATLTTGGTLTTLGDQVISSDARLKENLKDLSYTVDDIADAPAVTFDWKDGRGRSVGSIAQYWENVVPEAVHEDANGKTLAYAQLGVVNTIIIAKEMEAKDREIKSLRDELSSLKAQFDEMKAMMEEIMKERKSE